MSLPADDELRWIVATYGRLRAAFGEAVRSPALLQPTGEFFPDEFQLDAPSVERLLRRMIGYSPLADDLGVELAFVERSGGPGGGCGSVACGSGGDGAGERSALPVVQELEDGYRVLVAVEDVGNADVLAATLARAVGALVLHEAGEDPAPGEDELAAVACGFGVLVANGGAVWAKSCGGLRVARATVLGVEDLTVALALFAAVHGVEARAASAQLGATQREAYGEAEAWVESNPLIVESLRDRPALLEAGVFDLEPVRGMLGRWLHRRKLQKEMAAPAVAPAPLSEDKRRRLEEARRLVDEVLDGE